MQQDIQASRQSHELASSHMQDQLANLQEKNGSLTDMLSSFKQEVNPVGLIVDDVFCILDV